MSTTEGPLTETVTLTQAKALIQCLAHEQSLLLLSPPGVGKSDVVRQAAAQDGGQDGAIIPHLRNEALHR